MSTDKPKFDSSVPNGIGLQPGTERTYKRVYAVGRVDLGADGPPEFSEAIQDSLRFAADVRVTLTPERFFDTLLMKKVPEDVARRVAASAFLLDDETFISERSTW